MVTKLAVKVGPVLDQRTTWLLRRSLTAMPGVRQVVITHPDRVEIYYDQTRINASKFLAAIKARGMTARL